MRGSLRQLRAVTVVAPAMVGLVGTKASKAARGVALAALARVGLVATKGQTARLVVLAALAVVGLIPTGAAAQSEAGASSAWPYFGGTRAFTRHAPLDQIDRSNVAGLRVAWRRPAVDASVTGAFPELEPSGYLRSTPILVDGVLYASNAVGLVEAFDPGTGETLWLQEPPLPTLEGVAGRGAHGVAFWSDGEDRRIFAFRNRFLYALDAATGEPIAGFGAGGRVDLTPAGARSAHGGASPIVVGDVVVAAGTVDGAGDSGVRWRGSAPENVRGYDVRTGALRWTFHVVRDHPALRGLDLPRLGIAGRPVALVTATLLFIGEGGNVFGGIQDNMWGTAFRAYDKATGAVVWETELPAGTTGGPMTYLHEGRQYIVVPVGGRDRPAEWVALALP